MRTVLLQQSKKCCFCGAETFCRNKSFFFFYYGETLNDKKIHFKIGKKKLPFNIENAHCVVAKKAKNAVSVAPRHFAGTKVI